MKETMKEACQLPANGPRALAVRIRLLSFALEREVDRALAGKVDLTMAQFMLLVPIAMHPGITQRAIAASRNLTEAAISRQAEALRKKGYIDRGRNPDMKRERSLHLTEKGAEVVEQGMRHVDERLEKLFSTMSMDRRAEVVDSLDELIDSVGLECPSAAKTPARELATASS